MNKFKEIFENNRDIKIDRKVWDKFESENWKQINMVKSQWNNGKSIFHIKKFNDFVIIYIEPKTVLARNLIDDIKHL